MRVVEEIRRLRLKSLVTEHGGLAALNTALGRSKRDATLSQVYHANKDSKTGKPREMGSPLARSIEEKLGLPAGWMDTDPEVWPFTIDPERFSRLSERKKGMVEQELIRILEKLEAPGVSSGGGPNNGAPLDLDKAA